MKEVIQKEHWAARQQIEEQSAFYNDRFLYGEGGEYILEKREVTFHREELYKEIWQFSLSKVAKKYGVPYQKLKDACTAAEIPLPSQSYWGDLYIGKPVQKTPLPEFPNADVTVRFSVRTGISPAPGISQGEAEAWLEKKAENTHTEESTAAQAVPLPSKAHNDGSLYERAVLYEEVWQMPVTKVAERYGVSDVMIHEVCKTLNVPVPPRGYWAMLAAGKPVEKTPLPETIIVGKPTITGTTEEQPAPDKTLSFLSEDERVAVVTAALQLRVDPGKKKLHPVLSKYKVNYATWRKSHPRNPLSAWKRNTYRRVPEGEPRFYESVSEESIPRLCLILDALYSAVEALGGSVNSDLSVQIRGETVWFLVSEGQEQIKHALTKDELRQLENYEKEKKTRKYACEPKFRKYDYLPTGRLTFSSHEGSYISDSDKSGLEDRVGELLLGLYIGSEIVRIEREKQEAAKRKAEEEARQKELRRQRYNDEIDLLEALKNEVADYQTACEIRAYVSAVESKADLDSEQLEWIAWARAKADWYDPTMQVSDPIFGKRNHL